MLILLENRKFEVLEDIYKITKDIDYNFIKPEQAFAVRANRVGSHNFTSMDVARVAGQAIIDAYMESRQKRLKVNLDEPDVIIRVDVIHDEVFVGVDTTGDNALHKRWYRVYHHPASLNASIAASLIRLAGWNENKVLLDPMAGGGTILIEAALMGRNIATGKNRDFAYFKIFGEILSEEHEKEIFMDLYGIEKYRKHVVGATRNARAAGVADTIKFLQGDATKLEGIEANTVVTNPPYGLRIGSKRIIEELYSGFLDSLQNVLSDDATVVIITSNDKILRKYAEVLGYVIEEEIGVKYGNLDTAVFKLYLQ